jgi:AAA family ATP:ADP antiporter
MTYFGVGTALLVLPAAAMTGSGAFLIYPSLWTGSALNTADNAFSYSINQSAKEVLYVPTTRDEKYKAKAFIDMFVVRTAKAVAVLVGLGMGVVFKDFDSIRWISVITLTLLVAWAAAALYAGRKFRELTGDR